MERRAVLQGLTAAGLGISAWPSSAASGYPVRPVRIVVAFSPGGGTDTWARAVAPSLQEALGQPVIVENKPGAGAIIGSEYVAKAAPDGYTLLVTSVPHVTNPSLIKSMPFDTVKAFAPICLAVQSPFILVVPPASPITSIKTLAERARAEKLSFGSSGNGTADHLGMELLSSEEGISMVHVPYKGTGPAALDLMGGHIDLMFANVVGALPLIKSGKLRAIAATTARRAPMLPDLPSVSELTGRPFDVSAWTGILAPAGTPADIVAQVGSEVRKAMQIASVREFLLANGGDPIGSTPAEFEAFIGREMRTWDRLIKQANITT
ncbi:tripartite tricarboxylate transporter substrate binding protein [soil metagenome]